MSEFVRYFALSGALFCIGVFGLLTRRTFAGAFVSLGVALCGVALALIIGNYFINPASVAGYTFAIIISALGALYGALAAPFLLEELKAEQNRERERLNRPRMVDLLAHAVSDSGSVPFQISAFVSFIAAFLLFRVTVIGFAAFVLGVVSLKFLLARRLKKQRAANCGEAMIKSQKSAAESPLI